MSGVLLAGVNRSPRERASGFRLRFCVPGPLRAAYLGFGIKCGLTCCAPTVNPLPHPGDSAAAPFRRGTAWPASASLRELGRLRHSVKLVPTTRQADHWNVSRAESRATHGQQLLAHLCYSSTFVDHCSDQYHRVAR